jgi:CheY-like chemotaxis protein
MTRVLLVEDSVDVLSYLKIGLEYEGYEVEAFLDAPTALQAITERPPDVIVSDLGMPVMDGFEFLQRVRNLPALVSVPAIALTGAATEQDVEQALAFGFAAHLRKPVDVGELGKRIRELTVRRVGRKAG